MKTTRIVLFALLLGAFAGAGFADLRGLLGLSPPTPPGLPNPPKVDVGFFYDDLAPYGNWIERPAHGWVWTPLDVADTWRPYENGHWALTDQGWTWISDEPFGWATYHYGRWYDDPEVGWAWVPGDEWAPAWVSWQEGADYVGWAPLPPSVNLRPFFGRPRIALAPSTYVFVPERNFLAPRIVDYVVAPAQVVPIFRRTRNVTAYRFTGGQVFNVGVPVRQIQRVAVGPVPRFQVADLGMRERGPGMRVTGNRVAFFRPRIAKVKVLPPPLRPNARRAVVDVAGFQTARHGRPGRAVTVPARAKSLVVQTGQTRLRHADRLVPAAHGRALVQGPRRIQAQRRVAVPARKLEARAARTPRLRSAQRQHAHVVQPRHAQRVQRQRAVRTVHAPRPAKMRAAPQRMPRMQRQPGRPGPGRHRH